MAARPLKGGEEGGGRGGGGDERRDGRGAHSVLFSWHQNETSMTRFRCIVLRLDVRNRGV